MNSVERIIAPDPLYDHPGAERPERNWIIILGNDEKYGTEVARPDFGQDVLMSLGKDDFLAQSLNQINKAQIEAFIRKYFGSLTGIEYLKLEALNELATSIRDSVLYKTSQDRAREYVRRLSEFNFEEAGFEDRSVLFFAGFLDIYVLEPVSNRIQLLNKETDIAKKSFKLG